MTHPGQLLKEHGLRASKKRGQNFLVNPPTALAIAKSLGPGPGDVVLEIGSGLGALTLPLSELAEKVIAVEVDRGVYQVLLKIIEEHGSGRVEPLLADALKLDWAALAKEAGRPLLLAGNLPYAITSPLIFNLLDALDCWKRAAFMVQNEVAARLLTPPGSKGYGRMSVLVQTFCRVSPSLTLGPDQFFPRPAVDSRVILLEPYAEPLVAFSGPEEQEVFNRVVKAAFSQRRKTLLNSVSGGLAMPKDQVQRAVAQAGLDPGARAETLSPPEFGLLAQALFPC